MFAATVQPYEISHFFFVNISRATKADPSKSRMCTNACTLCARLGISFYWRNVHRVRLYAIISSHTNAVGMRRRKKISVKHLWDLNGGHKFNLKSPHRQDRPYSVSSFSAWEMKKKKKKNWKIVKWPHEIALCWLSFCHCFVPATHRPHPQTTASHRPLAVLCVLAERCKWPVDNSIWIVIFVFDFHCAHRRYAIYRMSEGDSKY